MSIGCRHDFGLLEEVDPNADYCDAEYIFNDYHKDKFEKYQGVAVTDDIVIDLAYLTGHIPSFWHNMNRPGMGFAYDAPTLFPPESVKLLLDVLVRYRESEQGRQTMKRYDAVDGDIYGRSDAVLDSLTALFEQAVERGKFIITSGI